MARKSTARKTAPRRSPGTAVRAAGTPREKIIAALMDLLAEKPFEQIGLAELAEGAGVSLSDLVRRELAPYATCGNTEIDGPGIFLKPEAGQAMAMVLHEVLQGAVKGRPIRRALTQIKPGRARLRSRARLRTLKPCHGTHRGGAAVIRAMLDLNQSASHHRTD